MPDDNQYATEDSFIDDAELVSFFIASEHFLTWMLAIYLDDVELVIKHKYYIEREDKPGRSVFTFFWSGLFSLGSFHFLESVHCVSPTVQQRSLGDGHLFGVLSIVNLLVGGTDTKNNRRTSTGAFLLLVHYFTFTRAYFFLGLMFFFIYFRYQWSMSQ